MDYLRKHNGQQAVAKAAQSPQHKGYINYNLSAAE